MISAVDIHVLGQFAGYSGTLSGSGTLYLDGGTPGQPNLLGGFGVSLDSNVINNGYTDLGNITLAPGVTVTNALGGTFDNNGDAPISGDTTSAIDNFGTFIKSGGAGYPNGSTQISVPLNNSGTIDLQTGWLILGFGQAPLTSSGVIDAASGTLLDFYGPSTFMPTSSVTADQFQFYHLGSSTVDVQLGGPNPGAGYVQITVGSATLSGNLQLELVNGFTPALNEQFTLINNQGTTAISGQFANLSEGSTITIGGNEFQITYQGGVNHNSVVLTVIKVTPSITWVTPADITFGTALTKAHQLNATASVKGTFAYTPAAGTILNAGLQTLSVTFTPNDTTDYFTTTDTVTINVNPADQAITWTKPDAIMYGTLLSSIQLDATVAGVAGGSAPGA